MKAQNLPPAVVLAAGALLLAIQGYLLVSAIPESSAVVDEPAHLVSGWLAVTQGDLRVNREHPPLAKAAAALAILPLAPATPPVAAGAPPSTSEDFEFGYSREFLYRANDPERLLNRARLPIVTMALAAGGIVLFWGMRLGGSAAGVAALALAAFEPNLLAHGRLVTTDMAVTLFTLATFAALERALASESGGGRWSLLAALAFGLALLSRFSALLIVPLVALLAALDRRIPAAPRWRRVAAVLAGGILVLHAGYAALSARGPGGAEGFSQSLPLSFFALAHPAAGGPLTSAPLDQMEASPVLRWIPIPVPRLWLEGLDLARYKNAREEGPGYLNGALSREGWWSYFVLALAMKATLPFLALALGGLLLLARGGEARRLERLYLLLPALGLLAMTTLLTRAQIGLRYVLPVLPFLCLAGGQAAAWLGSRGAPRERRMAAIALAVGLLGWHAGEAAAIHPYQLAYFNQAAGGPAGGWRHLVDSNLDWGQDLPGLRRFARQQGLTRLNLYYFGAADPQAYGLTRAVPPEPGWFAVSATHLAGVYLPDPDYFEPLRRRRPDATIGHSILLYHLSEVPPFLRTPPRAR